VVSNGRVERLNVHPKMTVAPCHKGFKNVDLLYHNDRLRTPLVRVGERGEGKWKTASWDDALALVAKRLTEVKERYGNDSILYYNYEGSHSIPDGTEGSRLTIERLFSLFGGCIVAKNRGSLCAAAAKAGEHSILATSSIATIPEPDCKLMVIWGHNPLETGIRNDGRSSLKAKENGCKFVAVDPVFTTTARLLGAQHVKVRPWTDTVLALALTKIIIENRWFDSDYVINSTNAPFLVDSEKGLLAKSDDGQYLVWDSRSNLPAPANSSDVIPTLDPAEKIVSREGRQYKTVWQIVEDNASKWTPEKAATVTGVTSSEIEELARLLGNTKPSKIHYGGSPGLNRGPGGEDAVFALVSLNAILGSLVGRYVPSSILDLGLFRMANEIYSVQNPVSKTVPIGVVAEAILNPASFETNIKAMYVSFGNPMAQNPNANKTAKAIRGLEFIAVVDMFMTDTARFADVVLPACTPLERCSIIEGSDVGFRWHNKVSFLRPRPLIFYRDRVVSPMYESKDDFEITTLLARKLGFANEFPWESSEEWIEEFLSKLGENQRTRDTYPWLQDLNMETLRKEGLITLEVPYAEIVKDYPTPSGRVELYSEELFKAGDDPLPNLREPPEGLSMDDLVGIKYPLQMVTPNLLLRAHSTFGNVKGLDKSPILINCNDASARGIKHNDEVMVFNERGSIKVIAEVTEGVREGVVSHPNGLWLENGSPSLLTGDYLTGYGENAAYNASRVQVALA